MISLERLHMTELNLMEKLLVEIIREKKIEILCEPKGTTKSMKKKIKKKQKLLLLKDKNKAT